MRILTRSLVFGLTILGLGMAGCATLSETSSERMHRWAQVWEHDQRALAEDFDALCQTERTSRLSRWHSR